MAKIKATNSSSTKPLNGMNDLLIDIIIATLKGKKNYGAYSASANANPVGFSYLLGQAIRQYIIPSENWHVTEAAACAWFAITGNQYNASNGGIDKYFYKETFVPAKTANMQVPTFKGTNKTDLISVKINSTPMCFNAIFIAEHTTPISDIIKILEEYYDTYTKNKNNISLQQLQNDMHNDVKNILDKIHITRMLKIEDRRITKCSGRIQELAKGQNQSPLTYINNIDSAHLFNTLRATYYASLPLQQISNNSQYNQQYTWDTAVSDSPYTITIQ